MKSNRLIKLLKTIDNCLLRLDLSHVSERSYVPLWDDPVAAYPRQWPRFSPSKSQNLHKSLSLGDTEDSVELSARNFKG